MRISGLGGKILNKLGASTQLIPGGEVYLALERGRIEATEYALPEIDAALGFPRIAKYYYFPGWHQTDQSEYAGDKQECLGRIHETGTVDV